MFRDYQVRLAEAEVFRIIELETLSQHRTGESFIDLVCRVAVALGARADGALSLPLHGPCESLSDMEQRDRRFRGVLAEMRDVEARQKPWPFGPKKANR